MREIAADPILRRAFAASPREVLRARGYETGNLSIPDHYDLDDLEARLKELLSPATREIASNATSHTRLRKCHLGKRQSTRDNLTAQRGPLAGARALPEFPQESTDKTSSLEGTDTPDSHEESRRILSSPTGKHLMSAWFGSNGTAVSRALVSGDNAAKLVPETVIGNDDRVLVTVPATLPFRWICRLVIMAANGTLWSGTGWFISDNVIATAGHCVFMQTQGGWVEQIEVSVYDDNNELSGPFRAEEVNSVSGWVELGNPEYDFGIVVLPKGFSTQVIRGHFGFGSYADDSLEGAVINIAGFPVDKESGTLWGNARRLARVEPNYLFYEVDTYGGMSGAPLICWTGTDYVAVGIHTYGDLAGNRGTRINASVFAIFETWLANYA